MTGRAVTLRFVPHKTWSVFRQAESRRVSRIRSNRVMQPGRDVSNRCTEVAIQLYRRRHQIPSSYATQSWGVVTYGGVRDSVILKNYGVPVFQLALRPNKSG